MSEKEQLWYLINQVLDGKYNVEIFCEEYTRIFDFELDYETLDKYESKELKELSDMTVRFSDDEDDLKIPHMYFGKDQILEKAEYVKQNRGMDLS